MKFSQFVCDTFGVHTKTFSHCLGIWSTDDKGCDNAGCEVADTDWGVIIILHWNYRRIKLWPAKLGILNRL